MKKCKYHCDYGDGEYCHYKGKSGCVNNESVKENTKPTYKDLVKSADEVGEKLKLFTTKAIETQDEFIFETVSPYCIQKTQMRITKEELVNAISKQRGREPFKSLQGNFACRDCLTKIIRGNNYCPMCGQKVKWE